MTKKHTKKKPRAAARHPRPRTADVTSEKPADGSVLAMNSSRTLRSSHATEKHDAPVDANDARDGDTEQAATLRDRVRAIVTSRLARLVTTATRFLPSAPRAFVRDHLHLEG